MRDCKKFCRPKTIQNPLPGDYKVTLNGGNTVYVSKNEFENKAIKYFKNYLVVEGSNIGKIKVYNSTTNKESIISPVDYTNDLEIREIIGAVEDTTQDLTGYIICHNDNINQDAIFSYEDWLEIDDSWDAIDIYGIETFDDSDEITEQRYVIMSNGTTFIIKASDYDKVKDNWEIVDTVGIKFIPSLPWTLSVTSGLIVFPEGYNITQNDLEENKLKVFVDEVECNYQIGSSFNWSAENCNLTISRPSGDFGNILDVSVSIRNSTNKVTNITYDF